MTEAMAMLCFILQKSPEEIRSEISTNKFKNLREWLTFHFKEFKLYDCNTTITVDDVIEMITDRYNYFDDVIDQLHNSKTITSYIVNYFENTYRIYKCELIIYDGSGDVYINGKRFFGHRFDTYELAKEYVQKQLKHDLSHHQSVILEHQKLYENLKEVEKSIESLNESDLQTPPLWI